jgi:hypothetical protein
MRRRRPLTRVDGARCWVSSALAASSRSSSCFLIMLLVTLGDFFADPKIAAHHIAK